MNLKLVKGTSLLDIEGLYQEGRVFIPGEALESCDGLWRERIVFLNSPLAGKRICVTILSPDTYAQGLPSDLEHFLALCSAAGAQLIYHDGGKFPAGDLILAIEPGGSHTYISYLGSAFRGRPLARKIAVNIKRGLKLTYLSDPVAFNKPHYNIRISLGMRMRIPAVSVQWPSNIDLGPWIFTSLMEYFGKGDTMEGSIFTRAEPAVQESCEPAVQVNSEPAIQDLSYDLETLLSEKGRPAAPQSPAAPLQQKKVPISAPLPIRSEAGSGTGHSASMSRAIYPDFFTQQDKSKKQIEKEPFT